MCASTGTGPLLPHAAKLAFVYEFAHGFVAVLWSTLRVMGRDGFAASAGLQPA